MKAECTYTNSPTAAFLFDVQSINVKVTKILIPHTMIFAIFPSELLEVAEVVCPTNGIPHSGFIPIGAEERSADSPERVELSPDSRNL